MLYDDIQMREDYFNHYLEELQSGVTYEHYDHQTMIDTLIGLKNSAWSIGNHKMVDHLNSCLALYNRESYRQK